MSTIRMKTPAASVNYGDFYRSEVWPRLTAEQVFTDPAHHWQKAGDKWRGGCPWHESKSGTSFYIDARTLLWRCPACQVGGGPVEYLHRVGGGKGPARFEEFMAILRRLSDAAGVPFPERQLTDEQKELMDRRERRTAILEAFVAYCEAVLWGDGGEAAAARAYLPTKGIAEDAARDLRLGYCDDLGRLKEFLKDKGFTEQDALEAGLFSGGRPARCVLTGYATFPWADECGRLLTVYGSWPGKPPEGRPKKMALPNPRQGGKEWEATKRSPYLLDRALRAGHRDVVLAEGVTDAAAAHAGGDTRVIACVAAELSHEQVKTLARRGVRSVAIALDPDAAGDGGVKSCVRQLVSADITPYVVPKLPSDPDDFLIAHGLEAWLAHVRKCVHGYRHEARRIIESHRPPDGWTDQAQDAAVNEAVAYAAAQPAGREDDLARHFWPVLEEETGADVEALRDRAGRRREKSHETNGDGAGRNGQSDAMPPHDAGDAWEPPEEPPKPPAGFAWKAVDLPTLAAAARRPEMLAKRVLVRHQPMIVGAPHKTLKTSVMCDLAVSLATATPFLGHFDVYKPVKVAMFSGESGEWTLAQTLARVCRAKGLELSSTAGRLVVQSDGLPQLSNIEHMAYLRRILEREAIEVFILDPLYLTLLAGMGRDAAQASNIYQMGPLFQSVARACLDVGTTPLLVHHTQRAAARSREPLGLEDLAYAGVAEFARQWLLLSRREDYDGAHPGTHKLWMNAGGSAGHGGLWALDIDEGEADDDLGGRAWDVTVSMATDARESARAKRDAGKKQAQTEKDLADERAMMNAIDEVTKRGGCVAVDGSPAAGNTVARDASGLSGRRAPQVVERLVRAGLIRLVAVTFMVGNGAKRQGVGLQRVPDE